MTFLRGNSLNWGFNEKYTSAQLNLTDAQWPYALDGNAGGTYAPSGLITINGLGVKIGGAGLEVSTAFSFTGSTAQLNACVFNAGFTVATGTATFDGPVNLGGSGPVHVTGGVTFTVDSTAHFAVAAGGFFTVACTLADFSGATVQTDDVTVSNSIVVNGTQVVTSTSTLELNDGSNFELSGGARFNRLKVTLNNANQDIVVADGHSFKTPGLSSNRVYTLKRTGASDGDEIEIYATNTSNDGQVFNETGTLLATLNYGTGGKHLYVRCNYSTAITDWEVIDCTIQ